jgi:PPOX class probable F420-dependent enzyme
MATDEERRDFLQNHRLALLGTLGASGRAQLSPVYYLFDGQQIVVSTTASRVKAKNVRRDGRVTLCALAEEPPFAYLTVYGRGEIVEENVVETMMAIGERMLGRPLGEEQRPAIEERARREGRVVLQITPQSFSP